MEALRRIKKKDGLESFEIVHVPAEVTCMIRNLSKRKHSCTDVYRRRFGHSIHNLVC